MRHRLIFFRAFALNTRGRRRPPHPPGKARRGPTPAKAAWRAIFRQVLCAALAFQGAGCVGGNSSPPASLVVSPTPASLTINPVIAAVMVGGATTTFTATLENTSETIQWALTPAVGTLSDTSGASITYTPPATAASQTSVILTASAAGVSASARIDVTRRLASVTVTPDAASVRIGESVQLEALATHDDSSTSDVTLLATWTSSDPTVISVSPSGNATPAGLTGGSATITVAFSGWSATSTLSIVPPIGPGVDDDPLLPQQWHIQNTGQSGYAQNSGASGEDISAAATYLAGYGGSGVKVAIVDTGLEIAHEDLAANVAPGSWNFLDRSSDPTSTTTTGDHGTSVAGLIAAVRNNGVGGMGVAPLATLNCYNYISSNQSSEKLVMSLGGSPANPRSDDVWVFNQSYGINTRTPIAGDPLAEAQYLDGVTNLRNGLGAVYVKAGGNGFSSFSASGGCTGANALGTSCQNANMDPYNRLPYNIVVGALDAKGKKSSYSSAGSAIWVSAPGGEFGLNAPLCGGSLCAANYYGPVAYDPAIVTTDQSACDKGYSRTSDTYSYSLFNRGAEPDGFNASCNYTNSFNGTSSAAPIATGAIALVLEANPSLSWRDVKHILASTAHQVDATIPAVTTSLTNGTYVAELPWTTNSAGYRFHNWYGFGRVDVDSAVAMAKTYSANLGTLANTGWIASDPLSLAIPDKDAAGVTAKLAVPASPNLAIEAVQIGVTLGGSPRLGDYGVELTSPSGTKSILLNIKNGYGSVTGPVTLYLTSNAFYGEGAAGDWTVKVVDGWAGFTGTLTSWKIQIYGH